MVFFVKELYRRYIDDEVVAYGAEMAYYFLLSIFPFLIFIITLIGYIPISEESILEYLAILLPHESYELVRENVLQILNNRNLKLMSFGFISMIWASASGMEQLCADQQGPVPEGPKGHFGYVPLSVLFTTDYRPVVLYFIF